MAKQGRCKTCETRWVWRDEVPMGTSLVCPICSSVLTRTTSKCMEVVRPHPFPGGLPGAAIPFEVRSNVHDLIEALESMGMITTERFGFGPVHTVSPLGRIPFTTRDSSGAE